MGHEKLWRSRWFRPLRRKISNGAAGRGTAGSQYGRQVGHPSDGRRQNSAASWEPVGFADLVQLLDLVSTADAVEGDVSGTLSRLRPGAPTGQIVTWAWVVDRSRSDVLLVDHSYFGRWLPPGGRAQPGEHPFDAVERELAEETGITTSIVEPQPAFMDVVPDTTPDGATVSTFGIAYVHVVDRSAPIVGEIDQPVAWWPLGQPPERRAHHHWDRIVRHLGTHS
jgi:8-oxo-dGTP pyrophosphatase MutT (NUDIX family)